MGNIQNKKYYNKMYLDRPGYNVHYKKSEYYLLWQKILKLMKQYKHERIVEIGCGTGQFAEMLYDNGFQLYYGFDFSDIAIKKAKAKVNIPFLFMEKDIMKLELVDGLIVCLETLEHIDDIAFLKNQKSDLKIIFSVPDFDDPAHVRYFKTDKDVLAHYKNVIELERVNKFEKYFICKGTIK